MTFEYTGTRAEALIAAYEAVPLFGVVPSYVMTKADFNKAVIAALNHVDDAVTARSPATQSKSIPQMDDQLKGDTRLGPAPRSSSTPPSDEKLGRMGVASWDHWYRLNREGRYPMVQWGPTEPNGEPLWCVSLVNPATRDYFAHTLDDALAYAEKEIR